MAELPDYHNALLRRLGVIEGMGKSATSNARRQALYNQQGTQLQAIQNRLSAGDGIMSSRAAGAPAVTTQNTDGTYKIIKDARGRVDVQNLINFGRRLEQMGYKVAENPHFGTGRVGTHSKGSKHYSGRAIDVNWAAGTSKAEQDKLAAIIALSAQYGLRNIFMKPGHYGHAHFDVGW